MVGYHPFIISHSFYKLHAKTEHKTGNFLKRVRKYDCIYFESNGWLRLLNMCNISTLIKKKCDFLGAIYHRLNDSVNVLAELVPILYVQASKTNYVLQTLKRVERFSSTYVIVTNTTRSLPKHSPKHQRISTLRRMRQMFPSN